VKNAENGKNAENNLQNFTKFAIIKIVAKR